MKRFNRVLALTVIMLFVLSTSVLAAIPSETVITSTGKAYALSIVGTNSDAQSAIIEALDTGDIYVKMDDSLIVDLDFNTVDKSVLPAVEYTDGTVTEKYAAGDGEKITDEEPGDLVVEEVNIVNQTTIKVYFSNGEVVDFTVDPLTEGSNTVTIEYNGKSFTFTVNYVEKAAVEDVELVNYRQMKVTFNTIVNEDSATNPQNYYFELVEGLAGKLGAAGDVTGNFSLKDIDATDTGWWNAAKGNIKASREEGKTVVTINLPEDARFDNGLTIKDMASGGDKVLNKDVEFYFSVRDIKDENGKRKIDTEFKKLIVKDDVKPELVNAKIEESDGNEIAIEDLSEDVEVKLDDKIVLEFSEPLEKHDTAGKEVKVFRDGDELDLTTYSGAINTYKDANTSYEDAKKLEIDINSTNGFLGGLTPTKGDTFVVLLTGIRDLAGNIIQDAIEFNIKIKEDEVEPPQDPGSPAIIGVEQVLDNVFRIEGNKAASEANLGSVNFTIKEADVNKNDVVVDLSTLTFAEVDGKYYAYVAVPAKYEAQSTDTGYLDFRGGFYVNKTIVVESAETTQEFETYTKENMHIEIDRQAPTLDTDQINIKYDELEDGLKLKIGFTDQNPDTWATDSTVATVQKKIFANKANGYIASVEGKIRVEVEYKDEDGNVFNRYVDIDYTDVENTDRKAYIDSNNNQLVINLNNTGLLVDKANNDLISLTDLKSGATFKVTLPKGVASDDYLNADTGLSVQTGTTAAAAVFIDESGRANDTGTDEHGYTSTKAKVTIIIGEDETTVDPEENKVPQTSKKLIGYDEKTDEIVILVTGLPTRESVEDLNNYELNDKTLKSLGAEQEDVLFADAESGDLSVVPETSGSVSDYKVIRIKLPKGSVKKDGPADFTVRGLKHEDGAMMQEVTTVVELKDNTAPGYVLGKIEGSNKIQLKFDEPVKLVEDALPTSAIRNFKVKVNGEVVNVLSVNVSENIIELEIANDNVVIETAEVEIKLNDNNKMEIADEAGNELEVTETSIVIKK